MSAQHAHQQGGQRKGGAPALAQYSSFGKMLYFLRENNGYSQQDLIDVINPFLRSRHKSVLARRMYGRMEKDERYPSFYELEPIYRAFVEKLGVAISDVERESFVQLARQRLEEKQKRRDDLAPRDWDQLADTLATIQQRRNLIHLLERNEVPPESEETAALTLRRVKALADILRTDTSHLLEREPWVADIQDCLTKEPPKKLVVVQAPMGAGKTHALALLVQRLQEQQQEQEQEKYFLLPYRFAISESKTPDDHFIEFLSTLLSDLKQIPADETKQLPLAQLMNQVLAVIGNMSEAGKRLIIVLDDAQVLFPSPLEWAPDCESFFERFVKEPHTATILCFTRIWPGWPARNLTYLAKKDLPELSASAGKVVWERSGFEDVPQELLEQASARCGGNPQLIEMWAFHQQARSGVTFAWGKAPQISGGQLAEHAGPKKNPHTRLIEEFLAQDSLFNSRLDVKARQDLAGVISGQLSHPTVRVLECLALSPLGLPFALLEEEFPQIELALDELVRASLLDLNMANANRASIVPLAREAQMQLLAADGRKDGIEQRVTDMYEHWLLALQDFKDDSEKSALVSEMVVRYIRQRQLLKSAELMVMYGWLTTMFGHMFRIQRVFEEVLREDRGKPEDENYEIGRLILGHRMAVHNGQKIGRGERDQIYQTAYDYVFAGKVKLQSHSDLEVLHNMRLCFTAKDRFQYAEASQMFDRTIERLQRTGQMTPEVYASFLYERGQLQLSWYEYEEGLHHRPEASHHLQLAADALEESIPNWRSCLKDALPLQENYLNFMLARTLNDFAYALREQGKYSQAQSAIEESIRLKKANAALPHSIAIALSELSQILLEQGKIVQGKTLNGEAIQRLEQVIQQGGAAHQPELGMILVERANILWQQAQLAEVVPLLERAVSLIGDKPSRQKYKHAAVKQIDEIRSILNSGRIYQLDWRWNPRYSDLVAYDDLFLLTQAGPFTDEEQEEWTRLFPLRDDEESKESLLELAAQSRKRESTRSWQEQCAPKICYPCLYAESIQEDIQTRAQGLAELRKEVDAQEKNVVVRRFYFNAIDEQLTILNMIAAVALGDQEAVWQSNLRLYGEPGESEWQHELKIALQVLSATLAEARHHELAGPLAQEIVAQLRAWNLSLSDIADEDLFVLPQETTQQRGRKVPADEKKQFSSSVVRAFFEDVLHAYGALDWKVFTSPARDYTYVDPNERKLVLPQKSFTVAKIRQLLAEEIETHTFRALAGQHSSLGLLSLGLARQEATEEGLAKWYIRRVNQVVGVDQSENTWIGTLAVGLAAGVLAPALSFQDLRIFLEKFYFLHQLLSGGRSTEDALDVAKRSAWARACRTFRGVPDLSQSGCCSLKDRIYLQGHLDLSRYFERGGDEQRLWVGGVGINDLDDLAELNILAPSFPHQHFALATDLIDQLARYSVKAE